jgi:hypothetical protein
MLSHGFPPHELLGLAWPGLTHWSPLFVGWPALALAVYAAWRWLRGEDVGGGDRLDDGIRAVDEGRCTSFWLALAATALVLSLGGGSILFDAFYHLAPGFGLFRGQERAAFLVSFALAMLAGEGLARWPMARDGSLALAVVAFNAVLLQAVGGRANLAAAPPTELATTPLIAALRDASGLGRVHDDDRLPRNFGVLHGIESTNGASPLVMEHYRRLRDGLLPDHEARFWQLTATNAVVSWRGAVDGAQPVLSVGEGDARTTVHVLANPSPYAWRAFRAVAAASDDDALAKLRDPAFDPFGTVLLHDGAPSAGPFGSDGATGVASRTPAGRVDAHTDGGTQGWIVFSEVWHPGWRATIDGAPAPVLRADVALVAVAVPAGEHVVALRFVDQGVYAGIVVSVGSLVALAAALVAGAFLAARHADASAGESHVPGPADT